MMPAIEEAAVLNAAAAEAMARVGVHACTDVSGFGLAGHLGEMLDASGAAAVVHLHALPLHDGVLDLIARHVYAGRPAEQPRLPAAAASRGGPGRCGGALRARRGGRRRRRRPVRRAGHAAGAARPRALRPADLRRPAPGRRTREAQRCCSTRWSTPAPAPGRSVKSSPGRLARSCSRTEAVPDQQNHHAFGHDRRIDPDSLTPADEERAAGPEGPSADIVLRALSVVPFLLVAAIGLIAIISWVLIILFGVGSARAHLGVDTGPVGDGAALAALPGRGRRCRAGAGHARGLVGDRARLQRGRGSALLDDDPSRAGASSPSGWCTCHGRGKAGWRTPVSRGSTGGSRWEW